MRASIRESIGMSMSDISQFTGQRAGKVDYLSQLSRLVQPAKTRSYDLMRIGVGSSVIDVGCGPAIDTLSLKKIVTGKGRVVGVDSDPMMIEKALEIAKDAHLDVEHVVADASALPFGDKTFDASRSERLLQHVVDAHRIVSEMSRVTRIGGIVVLVDTDHSTFSVNVKDRMLEWKFRAARADCFANGYIGRQLPGLLRDCGLANAAAEAFSVSSLDLGLVRRLASLDEIELAVIEKKLMSTQEVADWRAMLKEAADTGHFYASATFVLAWGMRQE